MGTIESRTVAIVSSVAQKVGDVLVNKLQHQQQQQQQQQQQHLSVGELEMKQPLTETDRERLQWRIERIKQLTEKGQLDLAEQEELAAWHNNTYDEWSNNRVVLELGEPPKLIAQAHFQEHIPVHAARAAPQMFARLRPLDEKETHIDPAIQEELGM